MNCELCQNTGYRSFEVKQPDGGMISYAKPCDHGKSSAPAGGFTHAGEGIPKLIENLNPVARQVRTIILQHRGEANPVKVEEISAQLHLDVRKVKAAVTDLLTLGRVMIGSSRDPKKPGYFLIEKADELNSQRAECLKHVQAWLLRLKAYDPDGSAARELYGQLGVELGIPVSNELQTGDAERCGEL